MSTPMETPSGIGRSHRAKLDGAAPLMKVVTRKIAFRPRQDVMRQGDVPRAMHLLLDGYGCHYRLLGDGRRQITAILLPGDLCDIGAVLCGRADHGVATFTPGALGEIPADHVIGESDPVLRRILQRQLLRDEAIAREWLVVLGRRTARERLAHLLCELRERMQVIGLGRHDRCEVHLTQADFAEALGLSIVHVNRTMQDLRRSGMIEFERKLLHIVDPAALVNIAEFDPRYLHV